MSEADMREQQAITLLAQIVNRASQPIVGTADAIPTCAVPLALLSQAKTLLREFDGTEFGTSEVRAATQRAF